MVAAFVIAARHRLPVDRPRATPATARRSAPVDQGRGRGGRSAASSSGSAAHRRAGGDDAAARHVHLDAGADLLDSSTCAATAATRTSSPRSPCSRAGMLDDGPGAENMVQLILGWEIMGLCSFMLIGHWWEEEANSRGRAEGVLHRARRRHRAAGRHGDAASAHLRARSTSSASTSAAAGGEFDSHNVLLWAAVALFIACIGKSRPVPAAHLAARRHGRPDAGQLAAAQLDDGGRRRVPRRPPLPGVPRGFEINVAGQDFNLIAVIGGITILIAALLAFVQNDIKRVLAYSTVSQLGYMMMGLGVGAWTPAVFHIFTHAFFKCCLFLCAGSVSHTGQPPQLRHEEGHGRHLAQEDADHVRRRGSCRTAALCGVPFFAASSRRTRSSTRPATTTTRSSIVRRPRSARS